MSQFCENAPLEAMTASVCGGSTMNALCYVLFLCSRHQKGKQQLIVLLPWALESYCLGSNTGSASN